MRLRRRKIRRPEDQLTEHGQSDLPTDDELAAEQVDFASSLAGYRGGMNVGPDTRYGGTRFGGWVEPHPHAE